MIREKRKKCSRGQDSNLQGTHPGPKPLNMGCTLYPGTTAPHPYRIHLGQNVKFWSHLTKQQIFQLFCVLMMTLWQTVKRMSASLSMETTFFFHNKAFIANMIFLSIYPNTWTERFCGSCIVTMVIWWTLSDIFFYLWTMGKTVPIDIVSLWVMVYLGRCAVFFVCFFHF